jgi:hypothetical protein
MHFGRCLDNALNSDVHAQGASIPEREYLPQHAARSIQTWRYGCGFDRGYLRTAQAMGGAKASVPAPGTTQIAWTGESLSSPVRLTSPRRVPKVACPSRSTFCIAPDRLPVTLNGKPKSNPPYPAIRTRT